MKLFNCENIDQAEIMVGKYQKAFRISEITRFFAREKNSYLFTDYRNNKIAYYNPDTKIILFHEP